MWIIKGLTIIICFILCIIGTIFWIIPAILMWDINPCNVYFIGVWDTYDKFFKRYDKNTTVD